LDIFATNEKKVDYERKWRELLRAETEIEYLSCDMYTRRVEDEQSFTPEKIGGQFLISQQDPSPIYCQEEKEENKKTV